MKMFTIIFCAILHLCSANVLSVYKNWSDLLVENIFIANIVVLSAAVLASSNAISHAISEKSSEAIIATCITCAILLLAVIVIHHRLRKISHIRSYVQPWRRVPTGKSVQLQALALQTNGCSSFEFREPLLEDSY